MLASLAGLASSPGRFFGNITAGNFSPAIILVKNQPGDEAIAGWGIEAYTLALCNGNLGKCIYILYALYTL